MDLIVLLIFLLSTPVSWVITKVIRNYAVRKGIVDKPNKRSSHTITTPRGGGLSIVFVFIAGIALLVILNEISVSLAFALGGGIIVAGIGWLDDKKGLPILIRALVHLVAAIWALFWLGGLPSLELGIHLLSMGIYGSIFGILWIVWLTNLYNFMDGIDGLASSEAVVVGIIGGLILFFSGAIEMATICWLLAVSCLGFLLWNWPPAKIFMGDVGSGFLGYIFAVITVASENTSGLPLLLWAVLLGVFLVDATLTLLRRIYHGEKWYAAHKTHAYQLAVQAGYSHKQVTFGIVVINIILGLFVILVLFWKKLLLVIFIAAVSLLIIIRRKYIGAKK